MEKCTHYRREISYPDHRETHSCANPYNHSHSADCAGFIDLCHLSTPIMIEIFGEEIVNQALKIKMMTEEELAERAIQSIQNRIPHPVNP